MGETVHTILRILNHSSLWAVSFMLMAGRPNFSEAVPNPRRFMWGPDRLWGPTELLLPGNRKQFVRV
jgi:hypothetical protein